MSDQSDFNQWAILELLGHVRLAGRVTEEEHFGTKMGRIDIPYSDGFTTQYFAGGSVCRLTPTTEAIARSVAARSIWTPAQQWELPQLQRAAEQSDDDRAADVADFLNRYTNGYLALDNEILDLLDNAIEQAANARVAEQDSGEWEEL